MKWIIILTGLYICLIFLSSCSKLTSEQEEMINEVNYIQETAYETITSIISESKDTIEALETALIEIQNNVIVEWAVINEQGISIQYKSGIRGGIIISDNDFPEANVNINPPPLKSTVLIKIDSSSHSLKSASTYKNIPVSKKTVLINPHYADREEYTLNIISREDYNFSLCGYLELEQYLNNDATVEIFTQLDEYGFVHLYSHGYAWPKESNITNVYIMTGEEINNTTTKKYWDDISDGQIPLIIYKGANNYFLSPMFISKYNDFSESKTFIYGGFCFSFLGDWPEEIIDAGALAYIGFNWSVRTVYNSVWSQYLVWRMFEPTDPEPMNLEKWFTETDNNVKKSYFDPVDKKNVTIHYSGAGDLVFWEPLKILPEKIEESVNTEITFKAEFSSFPARYTLQWDFGDGGGTETIIDKNEIKHTYNKAGTYVVTVKLYDSSNNQLVIKATTKATITDGSSSAVDFNFSWKSGALSMPGIDINCAVSGTVEGLNGNIITRIEMSPYSNNVVLVYLSDYNGDYKINFNSSITLNSNSSTINYSDGSKKTFTFGESGYFWERSGGGNYYSEYSSSGEFSGSGVYDRIAIWKWFKYDFKEYDNNNDLIEEGSSSFQLDFIYIEFEDE